MKPLPSEKTFFYIEPLTEQDQGIRKGILKLVKENGEIVELPCQVLKRDESTKLDIFFLEKIQILREDLREYVPKQIEELALQPILG